MIRIYTRIAVERTSILGKINEGTAFEISSVHCIIRENILHNGDIDTPIIQMDSATKITNTCIIQQYGIICIP